MKTGIILEGDEIRKMLHYDVIAEVFYNRESWSSLYLNQKIKLQQAGYTPEQFEKYAPFIQKAKRWFSSYSLNKVLLTSEELIQWRELLAITQLIIN
jgi:hypothetical protein